MAPFYETIVTLRNEKRGRGDRDRLCSVARERRVFQPESEPNRTADRVTTQNLKTIFIEVLKLVSILKVNGDSLMQILSTTWKLLRMEKSTAADARIA